MPSQNFDFNIIFRPKLMILYIYLQKVNSEGIIFYNPGP